MHNNFPLCSAMLLAGLTILAPAAMAENSLAEIQGHVKGMSPDGGIVVGYEEEFDSSFTYLTHRSFMWTPADGMKWLTSYDGIDVAGSGQYHGVNEAGMIAGAIKNDSMRLPEGGGGDFFRSGVAGEAREGTKEENTGSPIYLAAVWRGDKCYRLEGGLGAIDTYEDENDGSYAVALTADGSIAIGYEQKSYMPVKGMAWKYNAETDSYEYVGLPLEGGVIGSWVSGISPDGRYTWGNVLLPGDDGAVTYPAVWENLDRCQIVELPGMAQYNMGSGATAMSADGSKLLVFGNGLSGCYLAVYDIAEGKLHPVNLPANTTTVTGFAVTDAGNVFFKGTDRDWHERHFYYDRTTDLSVPMTQYFEECASGVEGVENLATAPVKGVSGDGSRTLFELQSYGTWSGSAMLTLDNPGVLTAPAPSEITFNYVRPGEVMASWKGIETLAEGLELIGYEAFIDDELVDTRLTGTTGGEFTVEYEAESGKRHKFHVNTLYKKKGTEFSSADSDPVYTYVSTNTGLYSFDNFDDCQIDPYGNPVYPHDEWDADELQYSSGVVSWSMDVRDWDNNNPYATVMNTGTGPWANAFTSRFHDATGADDFYLSFYYTSKEVNFTGQDRSTDRLDVEYTTDGKEWKLLQSICAADVPHGKWNFMKTDLGSVVGGSMFRVRFNAHGEGKAQLTWAVDCINISDKTSAPAPAGLRVIAEDENKVELTWQNTVGAWDASYMINSLVEHDLSAANEGKPVLMAIELGDDRLKAYDGRFISGVSAFIFDNPETAGYGSTVEAVVYEDGVEVARADFDGPFDKAVSSTAWLENPVKIQSGKSYRVAVDLVSYEAENAPMYYQKVTECVPGRSDLFSEDDGKTWQSLRDAFNEMYPGDDQEALRMNGNCVWSIHANITEGPVTDSRVKDANIIGYVIYRDGVQVNDMVSYAPYMRFIDEAPEEEAVYTVQAFYRDGRVSPVSEPCFFKAGAGVDSVEDADDVTVTVADGAITLGGSFGRATLYTLSGMRVLSTRSADIDTASLAPGVYMLRIETGYKVIARKVLVD